MPAISLVAVLETGAVEASVVEAALVVSVVVALAVEARAEAGDRLIQESDMKLTYFFEAGFYLFLLKSPFLQTSFNTGNIVILYYQ